MGLTWRDFGQAIIRLRTSVKTGLLCLTVVLLLLPGLSVYEKLTVHPQGPQVKDAGINLGEAADYPILVGQKPPALTARAMIVLDSDSAVIMAEKNTDSQLFGASTTKIMTALTALAEYDLNQVLTVEQASQPIGHSMKLVKGEKITVENLLYGILVESGNDAALALAQNYPGGYGAYVKKMNQKAAALNLKNTSFKNVSGVEQYGHVTTVRDLAILTKEAMKNDLFAKIVSTKTITVKSADGKISHNLQNINQLLGQVEGIKGVKTGWTEQAGECLVAVTERGGREIITVILGSQDRFGETKKLIDWAFTNHKWEKLQL